MEAATRGFWRDFCATFREDILEDDVNEDCRVRIGALEGFKACISMEVSSESELNDATTTYRSKAERGGRNRSAST